MVEHKRKVLLVEEDNSLRSSLGMFLEKNDFEVSEVKSCEEALENLEKGIFDLVISELKLQGRDGMWLLRHICKEYPDTRTMLMSAYGDVETAVQALKDGASDFLMKPFTPPTFIQRCQEVFERVPRRDVQEEPEGKDADVEIKPVEVSETIEVVGRSLSVKRMKDLLRMVPQLPEALLIRGENGVGKELAARNIHVLGSGVDAPFLTVHCDLERESDVEAELFGTETQDGALVRCENGTLFLKDVESLSPLLQSKLLQALEQGMLRSPRTGESRSLNCRIIGSTTEDLEEKVHQGEFKRELFYRINMVQLNLDPIRERVEDIAVFMGYFLRLFNKKHGKRIKGYSRAVLEMFQRYDWPGNVRELRNAVERATIFCQDEYIQETHISDSIRFPKRSALNESSFEGVMTLKEMERLKILETLKSYGGNRATTAKALGIGRNTLWRKLKEYEIEE